MPAKNKTKKLINLAIKSSKKKITTTTTKLKMNYLKIVILVVLIMMASLSRGQQTTAAFKCKYVLVEKSYYEKLLATKNEQNGNMAWPFHRHFQFGMSGRAELLKPSRFFKWHLDDCLNLNILDRIDVVNNVFGFNSDVGAKFR